MKWYLEPKIKENSYNALARRHKAEINLSFCEKKGFDLKQTLIKDTRDIKTIPIQSVSSVFSPKSSKVVKFSN